MLENTPNPHLKLLSVPINDYLLSISSQHFKDKKINILDIGGRYKQLSFANIASYDVLDIENRHNHNVIVGDITDPNLQINKSYDLIFSKNVFEHILNPWDATANILKLLKNNGLYMMVAPFSWRYHACPYDSYRYTHVGAQYLFERLGGMKLHSSGYYYLPDNELGRGKGHYKNKKDATLDGEIYRNNIQVFYIGVRDEEKIFDINNLNSDFSYGEK
jgi:hypothetical protein